jgi:hypothetical protein
VRQTAYSPTQHGARRRRPWLMALPLAVVILLAAGWSGFWFFAASQAETAIAGWRAREAQGGRVHSCSSQSLAGFPFRIEVRCADPAVEFRTLRPVLVLKSKDALVAAQIYNPTLLIGEFAGPLALGEPGRTPEFMAEWRLAQVSVRGTPETPERASVAVDQPQLARLNRGAMETVATATRFELHGRIAGGTVANNPVIETVLRLSKASAPQFHSAAARPTDGEIEAQLIGLKDFAPKPWSERYREIAAAGGRIEIKRARLAQDDILVVGAGTLSLSPDGHPNGQVDITVVGLDKLVVLLGVDQLVQQYLAQRGGGTDMNRIASGLDRILPGLGGALRNNSGSLATIGIAMLGEPREVEGRKGISLPLRFKDGQAFLGPVPIGQTTPLF